MIITLLLLNSSSMISLINVNINIDIMNTINDITDIKDNTSNTNDDSNKGGAGFCYSGLQSEGPPRHDHDSDTKRGVASAMKPPDKTKQKRRSRSGSRSSSAGRRSGAPRTSRNYKI